MNQPKPSACGRRLAACYLVLSPAELATYNRLVGPAAFFRAHQFLILTYARPPARLLASSRRGWMPHARKHFPAYRWAIRVASTRTLTDRPPSLPPGQAGSGWCVCKKKSWFTLYTPTPSPNPCRGSPPESTARGWGLATHPSPRIAENLFVRGPPTHSKRRKPHPSIAREICGPRRP